jgi:hypothetical protein|tara:strand:- start:64 stop:246 length:183 start_codon:yes stop_codon:yes gene_type:complete
MRLVDVHARRSAGTNDKPQNRRAALVATEIVSGLWIGESPLPTRGMLAASVEAIKQWQTQ